MPAGRPTKLNDELCDKIIAAIKEGIPPATAVELYGVNKRTHERWMKRGREAKRKNKWSEYCHRIESAKAFAAKKHLHKIMESKDWKAQKYLLTLLNPSFNEPEKVQLEHSGEISQEHKGTVELTIHDRIKEYERRFKEADSSTEGDNSSNDI